ncbi:MAG: ribose transport system substrate-binding protein [Thermoleophilaceae bacterium]|nr:ribose transport system substrate-binding protein [Thermoleophilaceae bacterium]
MKSYVARLSRLTYMMALVLVAMALVVTACGGDEKTGGSGGSGASTVEGSDNSGLEAAQALVDEYSGPSEYAPEGEPIDVAAVKDKVGPIHLIAPTLGIPFVQVVADAFEKAGEVAGVEGVVFDGQNDISEMQRGIEQAIQQKAGAIVIFSIQPESIAGPLKKAQEAGIPVVSANNSEPDDQPAENTDANATYSYSESGRVMAAYAAVTDKCEVNAHMITVAEYAPRRTWPRASRAGSRSSAPTPSTTSRRFASRSSTARCRRSRRRSSTATPT